MSEHFHECPGEFSGNHGCYGKRRDWAKLFPCMVLALRLEYFHKCQPHQRALQWTRRSCPVASISGIMWCFQMLVKYLGTQWLKLVCGNEVENIPDIKKPIVLKLNVISSSWPWVCLPMSVLNSLSALRQHFASSDVGGDLELPWHISRVLNTCSVLC